MTELELVEHWESEDEKFLAEGLKAMLETFAGRSVIFRLITGTGVWDTSPYRADPHATAFEAGRQQVALDWLHKLIEVSPLAWPDLQKEMIEQAESRKTQLAQVKEEEDDG